MTALHNTNDISSEKERVKVVCDDEKGYNDVSDDNTVLRFKKLTVNAATPIRVQDMLPDSTCLVQKRKRLMHTGMILSTQT